MRSPAEIVDAIQHINIIRHILRDDGTFPNSRFPLLVYKKVLQLDESDVGEDAVKEVFETNGWVNAWVDGIYDFHHYHSTAHEVLGVIRGSALVMFGGPNGVAVPLEKGDVVVIPAGVAHKSETSDDDFTCVGAYPEGQEYDIRKGKKNDRPETDRNIEQVPLPLADPVFGIDGPVLKHWPGESRQTIL
jgi:uncharacterized protein YjlB